ncbi:MAG: hypothetical protein ACR2JC_18265 [Chloroflexota bacterium]
MPRALPLRLRWSRRTPSRERLLEQRIAPLVAAKHDLPIQLGTIVTPRLPTILEVADVGLEGAGGEAAGTGMHDVVLGREVLGHQTADRVPIHAHGPCDAPETLTRGMPTPDLLPARDPGRSPVLGFFLARDSVVGRYRLPLEAQPL